MMRFEIGAKLADAWRDQEFWEMAWQAAWEQSLLYRQQPGRSGSDYWNRRAARFTAQTQEGDAVEQIMKVVHLLGHKDAMKKDSRVLDIGSGPGNYAVPIARRVHQVVALDPAEEMLKKLAKRAAEADLTNIVTAHQAWEDVDLDQAGWRGAFDIVLALMAPPFNGAANLKKMLAACRGVFLGGGYLRRDDPVLRELWQELGLGEMPDFCPDPFYAYHWLYASGYYPDLEMEHHYTLRQLTPKDAQAELEDSVYPYLDLTPAVSEKIRGFVEERTHGGVFLSARSAVAGWVICTVGAPVPKAEQVDAHHHDHDHPHDHDHHHDHEREHGHEHEHDNDDAHHHEHEHDHPHDHDHGHEHDHDHHHDHDHPHDHDHHHDHEREHSHEHEHDNDDAHHHEHEHDHPHDHGQEHDHGHHHEDGHDHGHAK
jgi:SAM-dependent methyltransferase